MIKKICKMGSKDTYSYKGMLVSDSFIKRSLATFCYAAVGKALILFAFIIIIGIPSIILVILLGGTTELLTAFE